MAAGVTDRLWEVSDLVVAMSDFIVVGVSVLCGLWWFSFPNSVLKFYRALYGSRFSPRPLFIRLAGGVWIAASLWIFWLRGIRK